MRRRRRRRRRTLISIRPSSILTIFVAPLTRILQLRRDGGLEDLRGAQIEMYLSIRRDHQDYIQNSGSEAVSGAVMVVAAVHSVLAMMGRTDLNCHDLQDSTGGLHGHPRPPPCPGSTREDVVVFWEEASLGMVMVWRMQQHREGMAVQQT